MQDEKSLVLKIQEEIKRELATPEVVASLIETRFKGLTEPLVRKAMVEGMIRGFSIKDFFEGNVYAIPFKQKNFDNGFTLTYILVNSLDNSRKIGAKSGIVGEDAPIYGNDGDDKSSWCSLTVHKQFENGHIGDFTAKVYFDEFSTGKQLWSTKPRTMIAKVAEMHALRKACPELAQSYIEEEVEKPIIVQEATVEQVSSEEFKAKMVECKNLQELSALWPTIPATVRTQKDVEILKEDLKLKFENENPKI